MNSNRQLKKGVMSKAKSLFDQGQLGAAIEELTREVKDNPSNTGLRTFLFELLCFAGDWDRAERQLDVIGHQNAQAKVGVEVYRNNIKAERDRRRLFCNGVQPSFLTEPPAYVDLLLAAINGLHDSSDNQTRRVLDRVEKERPPLAGKINDCQFQDFRDCDELTGPVLELILQGKYTWLPFEQLRRLEILTPRNLRDLLWANARIEATDGTVAEVFLPALYAGSSEHPNDDVKLGRRTEWKEVGDDLHLAAGSKLFMVDDEEKQIFETLTIEFGDVVPTYAAVEAVESAISVAS
jgi:type VI secretion system protein ImpE